MRRSTSCSIGLSLFVFLAACSENPAALKHAPLNTSATITPTGSLDQTILQILSLYPKGLETAATARWGNVKSKYAAGLKDPSQMVVAKQMLADLSDWLTKKAPDMSTPPNNETKSATTSRAVLYMAMYVYNGPDVPPPTYNPTADAVTGIVTPAAPATIVTPTTHAGVQFEAGSVAENTIIVVRQNPTPYPENCSGPLQTKLCQYPQFYFFDAFPHKRLLKPAKFNVCHVNDGQSRQPLADHDRFRLAHEKPADPADYTPGSTIRDQAGENIEILPLVAQTFSTCEHNSYTNVEIVGSRPLELLSRFASAVKRIVTPKTAYAIDVGLGGLSVEMSPFNDVDPQGVPDLVLSSLSVAEGAVRPGDQMTVSYTVNNQGTATQVPIDVSFDAYDGRSTTQRLGFEMLPSLAPGSYRASSAVKVSVPADLPVGNYTLQVYVNPRPSFLDSNTANNLAQSTVVVSEVWRLQEGGGFHTVWTKNATGGFDGDWFADGSNAYVESHPLTFARDGNSVQFQRTTGNPCYYTGTIATDTVHASGTEFCPNGTFAWNAVISAQ